MKARSEHRSVFGMEVHPSCVPNTDLCFGNTHFKTIYGIETLIQAIAQLKNEKFLSTFKLLLVGDGPEKENYLSLADSLGILDEIEFPGFIMNNQLASYYQKMDVVVIP